MWQPLIESAQAACGLLNSTVTVDQVGLLAEAVHPCIQEIQVSNHSLPWGRYLIHHDEPLGFNIQLDVFSENYTGLIHAHDTWGAFWVIRGALHAEDFWVAEPKTEPKLLRHTRCVPGGFQCFAHGFSDWHRVGTEKTGPQTVSIHIYGREFNLDEGTYFNEEGELVQARRGNFKNLRDIESAFGRCAAI